MTTKSASAATLSAIASGLFCTGPFAQQPDPQPPGDTLFFVGNGASVMPFGGKVDIIGGEGSVVGEVVVDKPYSADSITESTQILVDGNRITSTNRARIYRDSQGRTRREHKLGGVGAWQAADELVMVMINDPVKDVSYFLDPTAQTAREIRRFKLEAHKLEAESLPATGPAPDERGNVVMRREWVGGAQVGVAIEGNPFDRFEIALPPPGAVPMGPGAPIAFGAIASGTIASFGGATAENATEDLGEQVLQGVLTRGTRQTQTIPAGAIGNESPIEIVQEQWYSPDLETVVQRRNFDPRFGETSYRLINVDRSEPSPDLFAVPQDYDLRNEPSPTAGVRFREESLEGNDGPRFTPPAAGQRFERRVFLVQPDPAQTEPSNTND